MFDISIIFRNSRTQLNRRKIHTDTLKSEEFIDEIALIGISMYYESLFPVFVNFFNDVFFIEGFSFLTVTFTLSFVDNQSKHCHFDDSLALSIFA